MKTFDGYLPVENSELYYRAAGHGQPLVILHGGPDFNHAYLLPEMDSLADSFHIIYYDQRGRGKSAGQVQPEEVSIDSEIEDLERVREYFGYESIAVLGHSWGVLLALEYAIRHPVRVSHLVLLNSAPASRQDFQLLQESRIQKAAKDLEKLKEIRATQGYKEGDLNTEAEYYRVHFRSTLKRPGLLESVVRRLRSSFTQEDVVKAREIEDRLMEETWLANEYDLYPHLGQLRLSALVIHGDRDLVPPEIAAHIAEAIPGSRLVVLEDTGHFSIIERPEEIRRVIVDFFSQD
jgi:proline iminopeptidase